MNIKYSTMAFLVGLCLSQGVAAQDADVETAKDTKDAVIENYVNDTEFREIDDDLLVPSSPAFSILGISPDNVIRPSNPKEFGAAVLNGVDSTGTLQTGVALEFSPHIFFNRPKLSLAEYRNNTWRRVLARSQFSLATAKAGSDGDKTVRVAAGFRTVLFDRGDVRWSDKFQEYADTKLVNLGVNALKAVERGNDIFMCRVTAESDGSVQDYLTLIERQQCPELPEWLRAELEPSAELNPDQEFRPNGQRMPISPGQQILETLPQVDLPPREAALEAMRTNMAKAWTEQLGKFKDTAWNASNVTVGMAVTAASETGKYGDLGDTGYAVYLTGAYGFEEFEGSGLEHNAHFITHVRYQTNQLVTAVEDGMTPFKQDLWTVGSQLRIRGPELGSDRKGRTLVFFGEFDYQRAKPENMAKDTSYKYAAGLDIALTERVHFQFSVGEEDGSKMKRDSTFVLGDLKWSF